MTRAALVVYGGVILCTLGMMLVILGIITSGLFLPGAIVILIGCLVCALAGVLAVLPARERTP
jgi:hypothetical protein